MVVREVVERLRQGLADGRLAPEGRLPPERDLAQDLGVSRGTLRKALMTLEREGRVWRHVGRGTFTSRPGGGWRGGGRTAAAMDGRDDPMSQTSPAEVMEVRLMLEPRIAALAALRATPAELREMDACVVQGERAADVATFETWDGRLHRLVAASARNALLLTLFDTVNAAREGELWGRLKAASLTPERRRGYVRQHARIVAAIRDRDTDRAARLMDEHLAAVRRHLLR